ncbi:conserved hypothetical protein [Streptomyces sviceus ATCC 29083]|uniref:Uncharacterized protein n=1 Tax=Streptomyces sviceus (strain ATCC 29083 / DSM 924 / JCM 4929 / NBRC 13980 / NCIMB 11184 / NRRL 5439 / UC 5370) TaxID=463191 RepID=B5HVQ2_STRX2|nr:conserved hypothetical protein [Streptomyces sviceus ATCC 29083]
MRCWTVREFVPNAMFYGVIVNAFSVVAFLLADVSGFALDRDDLFVRVVGDAQEHLPATRAAWRAVS